MGGSLVKSYFLALLDALAPPRQGKLTGTCLFRTNLAGAGDHYAHRASRRVSERCGGAVRWIIAIRALHRVRARVEDA